VIWSNSSRIFSSPISPSFPTPASYSGEFRVRVRVPGLGLGVSGGGDAVPAGPRGRSSGGRPARRRPAVGGAASRWPALKALPDL
jgi:hypothetical protein